MLEFYSQDKKIEFDSDEYALRLTCSSEYEESFVKERLETDVLRVKKTFYFNKGDLYRKTSYEYIFILGIMEGDYYRIKKDKLNLDNDLLLYKDIKVEQRFFIANRGISIFRKINSITKNEIVIGGNREDAIPLDEYMQLIKKFPTSTELTKYTNARIEAILGEYIEIIPPAQVELENYLNRKKKYNEMPGNIQSISEYELNKFEYIYKQLKILLDEASETYSERQWQQKIIPLLLLIFPRYVSILKEVVIKDFYTNPHREKDRQADLMLIDADGTVDLLELKKPSANIVLSKTRYRDNYHPNRELSGAIMQVEKYIFYLNKWGIEAEKYIEQKYCAKLPDGLRIKVINPRAIVILGRSNTFSKDEKRDFEIIRRQYSNIAEIMTYDDLLDRVRNIIEKFKQEIKNMPTAIGNNSTEFDDLI